MNKKIVIFTVAMVLLLGITIGTTFAYLQSITTSITNTFTFGKVAITLDETKVDLYGKPVTGEGAGRFPTGNQYKLIPEQTYTKDPIVHIDPASESSWLFVKVENGITEYEIQTSTDTHKTIADQMVANGWERLDGVDNVWVYGDKVIGTVLGGDNVDLDIEVFAEFTVAEDAKVEEVKNTDTIVITAYAIQADGLATAAAAWNAFVDASN